jgi:hypothetical protein
VLDDVLSIACDNTEQHPKNRSKRTTPAGIRHTAQVTTHVANFGGLQSGRQAPVVVMMWFAVMRESQ